jgi:ubiquinone/menaquinone biosynthesis C-methylase UbiE
MDTAQEALDYDQMDHSTVNRLFVRDFLAFCPEPGFVLDLGTGTAQIPIELCQQHPNASVVAIDAAAEMLLLAEKNIEKAQLGDRIRVQLCDAKELPLGDNSFSSVISNSIIHHIPNPLLAMSEMLRVLEVGGALFVRDLLRPKDRPTLESLVHLHAGDANEHQRKLFADSLHAALSLEELRELIQQLGRDPNTVQQTSDRHWTWAVIK